MLLVVFFFFQAEDGIRDLTVTGVQTCALPISRTARSTRSRRSRCCRCPAPPVPRRPRPSGRWGGPPKQPGCARNGPLACEPSPLQCWRGKTAMEAETIRIGPLQSFIGDTQGERRLDCVSRARAPHPLQQKVRCLAEVDSQQTTPNPPMRGLTQASLCRGAVGVGGRLPVKGRDEPTGDAANRR